MKQRKNYLLFFLFLAICSSVMMLGKGFSNVYLNGGAVGADVVPGKKDFKVFYASSYWNRDNIDLEKEGFLPIYVIYEADILTKSPRHKNDRNYSEVDPQKIKVIVDSLQKIREKVPSVPVCIDIEGWQLDRGWEKISVPKYVNVLKLLKPYATEIGLYNRTSYAKANEIQNIMFPSYYTRYPSIRKWRAIVDIKLQSVKKNSGKNTLIYAFITPQFNHNYKRLGLADTFLPAKMWRQELEFLYDHVDGVVIWGSKRFNPEGFTKNSPWFKETLAFMQEHSLR